jgi:3D (Asp-Asp-Asp) domain-containing protein
MTKTQAACFVAFVVVVLGIVVWMYSSMMKREAVPGVEVWAPEVVVIHEAQRVEFEATGYAIGPPYASITKSGHPVINKGCITIGGMDIFTIAVDPNVIPLGSIVYIDSLGVAMATDTGKKIKGMLIDVCFSNMDEATQWGRRQVQITMLRRGN